MNNNSSLTGIALAIAMPVFNEQAGISDTLLELDQVFSDHHLRVALFLQDDQSTDDTVNMVLSVSTRLTMRVGLPRVWLTIFVTIFRLLSFSLG